jgi:hypothetical protein
LCFDFIQIGATVSKTCDILSPIYSIYLVSAAACSPAPTLGRTLDIGVG